MIDVKLKFQEHCQRYGIDFQVNDNVKPYNDTTLFCPAGMQQFKMMFNDETFCNKTIGNVQSCLRLNDCDEVGDGTHLMYFNMLGLFSFRNWSLIQTIQFWTSFIEDSLKLKIDYVTINPDKMNEWSPLYYNKYEIKEDTECTWSDGESEMAYCTEFYINDIEVGNIVNPKGNCIDAGFGLERLESLVNKTKLDDKSVLYKEAIKKIIESGYKPGYNKQGYVLRKLLRNFCNMGLSITEDDKEIYPYYKDESERQHKMIEKYLQMKDTRKCRDKSKEWWFDTHGIDLDLLENISEDKNKQKYKNKISKFYLDKIENLELCNLVQESFPASRQIKFKYNNINCVSNMMPDYHIYALYCIINKEEVPDTLKYLEGTPYIEDLNNIKIDGYDSIDKCLIIECAHLIN
jgi:alanyl-tRNA synthetase